ncbi:MAG TPA: hypothetical protein VK609_02685 [Mucilaginibacter sp.]|nr:hypothetical protein [Mucilaginibacter sp.]
MFRLLPSLSQNPLHCKTIGGRVNWAYSDFCWKIYQPSRSGLKLVTTDGDFDHLHEVFFDVQKLKPADLR